MAAVRVTLQIATVMQTVTCLKIVVEMFQVIVRREVLHNNYYYQCVLFLHVTQLHNTEM